MEFRIFRSSRADVFSEKVVLQNFAKITGKHLGQSLIFNKAAGLRPTTLLKKDLVQVFSFKIIFLADYLTWLQLNFYSVIINQLD